MSAITGIPPVAAARTGKSGSGGVTLARVIDSEWTKLRSLRSTRWSLVAAFVAMAALGPVIAAISMANWAHHHHHHGSVLDASLGGYHLAQLAIGVLGVMVISGEYSTGQIRSSLMAVPRRLPFLLRRRDA